MMAQMYQLKCHNNYYILEHMDKLIKSHARLAKLGTTLTDPEYYNIITNLLSNRYKQIAIEIQSSHKVAQDTVVAVAAAALVTYN